MAVTILATAILGSLSTLAASGRAIGEAIRRAQAADVAADALTLAAGSFPAQTSGSAVDLPAYRCSFHYESVTPRLLRVTVTVQWTSGGRVERLQVPRLLFIPSENRES